MNQLLLVSVLIFLSASTYANNSSTAFSRPLALHTEIQMEICGSGIREVASRLNLKYEDSKTRETFLFDGPDHRLTQQGVILRLRRTDEKDRFTIKLRDPDMNRISQRLRDSEDFKCEVDHHVGRLADKVYTTCSLEKSVEHDDVDDVLAADAPVYDLLTSLQRHFVRVMKISEGLLTGATSAPVVHQRVWKFSLPGLSSDAALEYSRQYNSQRIEFSLRVPQSRGDRAREQALTWLSEKNLIICD